MSKRDVDDFPFAYLAEKQSPNQGRNPGSGGRYDSGRNIRRSASREIEKLLIISLLLTALFVVLLVISITVGMKNKKEAEAKVAATSTASLNGSETDTSSAGQVTVTAQETNNAETTGSTELSVIHIE